MKKFAAILYAWVMALLVLVAPFSVAQISNRSGATVSSLSTISGATIASGGGISVIEPDADGDLQNSIGATTTITHSSLSLGATASDRIIVVAFGLRDFSTNTDLTVGTATLGGVDMEKISARDTSTDGYNFASFIFWIKDTSNTSADFVFSTNVSSRTYDWACCYVYNITGAEAPISTYTQNGVRDANYNILGVPNGLVIATHVHTSAKGSITWGGDVTEDFEAPTTTGDDTFSTASCISTSPSVNVTTTYGGGGAQYGSTEAIYFPPDNGYLYRNNFESEETADNWTESGAGTITWGYQTSPAPLHNNGASSVYLSTSSQVAYMEYDLGTTYDNLYVYFQYHMNVFDAFNTVCVFLSSSGTTLVYSRHGSTDGYINVQDGTASDIDTGSMFSTDTVLHVWMECERDIDGGTPDANYRVYVSHNSSKPASPIVEVTNGVITTAFQKIRFGHNGTATTNIIYDSLIIDDSPIPSAP